MELDPELKVIVDLANAAEPAARSEAEVERFRAEFAGFASLLGSGSDDVQTTDASVPGPDGPIPVRSYRPRDDSAGPLGTLVWFHGGGWVIGDLDTHDALCRDLATGSAFGVLSVGYRLAPEHRFPAAHDAAEAVVALLLSDGEEVGVDPTRIAMGGDSAGGHLATVTARRLVERGGDLPDLRGQVLVYPVTDLAGHAGEHPSKDENAEGLLLTAATMDFFADTYLPDQGRRAEPDASPLRAPELGGLPPALVVVASHDPLRDEGLAYARRLTEAGVPTEVEHLEGAVHLCAQMGATAVGRRVVERVSGFVSAVLSPAS